MSLLICLLLASFIFFVMLHNNSNYSRYKPYLKTMLLGGLTLFLAVTMIAYPKTAFDASLDGLQIWWNVVFPALLPFFIISELLMGLGVVNGMGVLLEPLMRPVFNVPGEGSFVMAVGLASGFPIGAILTARLRRDGYCSKTEGERLMSFCNTADPLFMFGAVAVGMLGYPSLGITIASAHYLSALSVGIIMRFYNRRTPSGNNKNRQKGGIFTRAVKTAHRARLKDGRTIGQLLGDTVRNSVNSQLLIGGFIILFSVIVNIMDVIGLVDILSKALTPLLTLLGFNQALFPALVSGFFEIDLGCKIAGDLAGRIPLSQIIIACSAIIGWSGLSVHAQVASIISNTDMSVMPYSISRIFQAILAGIYAFLMIKPVTALQAVIPAFFQTAPSAPPWQLKTLSLFKFFLILLLVLLALSLSIYFLQKIKLAAFKISRH